MKSIGPNVSGLSPLGGIQQNPASNKSNGVSDSVFRDQLKALQDVAQDAKAGTAQGTRLQFSNHAIDRMRARGISFSPEQMAKIEGAVGKAAAKGAKDTLLLTDESALIVSVKDNKVVTVMDKAALKENVFTNIDSTVVL